jgi:hypothetical protein
MDSSVLLMTNLESTNLHEAEFSKGGHRLVAFKKISGSLNASNSTTDADDGGGKKNHGRLVTSVVAYTGSFHHLSLNNFITDILNGKYLFSRLPALPTIKTRSKKNEEAERTKRKRYLDQKMREAQRQQDSSSSNDQQRSPDGIFTKEQRKADRDRLREEHRKKQNVRDLTPEEIAERERLRRKRMEEEAAKWNVLPDDAPPEGELLNEETDIDGETEGNEAGDSEVFDEEDVMDLDI